MSLLFSQRFLGPIRGIPRNKNKAFPILCSAVIFSVDEEV